MRRTCALVPAVVGLALLVLGAADPALASAPAAARRADAVAVHRTMTGPDRLAAVDAHPSSPAPSPAPSGTPSTGDMAGMPGMDGMAGMDDDSATGGQAEHGDAASGSAARPRTAVLSAFVGVNGAVLVTAGVLRRRDLTRHQRRPRRSPAPTSD